MKIIELKKRAREEMGVQYNELEVDLWLGEILEKGRAWVFANGDFGLDAEAEGKFWHGVDELKTGRPFAQLTGFKEFYGLPFKVDGNVLIPRPESELIVDLAKDFIVEHYAHPQKIDALHEVRVLDVGTGSGCIILALASVMPSVSGVGVEISEKALSIAKENDVALHLQDRVKLVKGDLLEGVEGAFDIIVANLPYIGREKFNFVAKDVEDFEPEVALFGGPDGLDLYRKMFGQLLALPWRPRLMIGEFGFGQEEEMRKVLADSFSDSTRNLNKKVEYKIVPDLAGIPRVFVVTFI